MDDTIRVTDPEVSAHLAEVYEQMRGLIGRYPKQHQYERRSQASQECKELSLLGSPYPFDREGHDGESEVELRIHKDPLLGQQVNVHDQDRCISPLTLLELTRTAITVNGPARSVEVYKLRAEWRVTSGYLGHKNLSLVIRRQTTTTTEGLPTATTRRYKSSQVTDDDVITIITFDELVKATGEMITALSTHAPS